MPVRKQEAHRALELLEEYHSKLNRHDDRPLREAIERVITIFKSRLFQALLDIQEFYEETLLSETKSLAQKTYETNRIADRWETNPPIISPASTGLSTQQHKHNEHVELISAISSTKITTNSGTYGAKTPVGSVRTPLATSTTPTTQQAPRTPLVSHMAPYSPPSPATNDSWQEQNDRQPSGAGGNGVATHHNNPYQRNEQLPYINGSGTENGGEWEHEDIVLEKGTSGLGFSIAGGNDNPHVGNDPSIYVTKIIPGGAASYDTRLKKGDVILRVNTVDLIDVPHSVAVDALKKAVNVVKLYVRRRRTRSASPPVIGGSAFQRVERIELSKGNKGLGFSIAGGVGNEHIPGDTSIYVTKIIDGGAAQLDGRMQVGDKLLAVGNMTLDTVPHETAVAALKATSDRVVLTIAKTSISEPPPPPTQLNTSFGLNEMSHYSGGGGGYQTMEQSPPRPRQQQYGGGYETNLPAPPTATRYAPPPVPESPTEVSRGPRRITLTKGPSGLGFNIVGGEDGEGIYISYILPGGVADISGILFKGDQLLEVNNTDLRRATHEDAAAALKNSGQRVNILAQYRPEEYTRFEAKIAELRDELINQGQMPQQPSPKRELYVRALFDYDPTKDSDLPSRGLAFNYGDTLHVVNASDDEWWQAKKVMLDGSEEGYGIIPSKKRVEKRERARRKRVNFGNRQPSLSEKHSGSKKSLSLTRKFPFMKSKERVNEESDVERPEEVILSYEAVERRHLNYARPVVILGPLKDRINDDLIAEFPDRYGSCVPHTSRARRDHEIDGRDYHFVTRDHMERDIANHMFIEAGQYNQNLYGTSIAAVRHVAEQGKHCILDVSGNAIKRLRTASFEWNRRLSEEESERQFQRSLQIEQDFAEFFTAIVQGDTPEEVYAKVKEVIKEQSAPMVWVPCPDRL